MSNSSAIMKRAAARMELLRREAQRGDFWAFCRYQNPAFFLRRPVLKTVADGFQHVYDAYKCGETYNLAVSLPPRAGKSYISTLFISFMLGHFPVESVMRNCCSHTLYQTLSRSTLRVVRSPKFHAVFPDITLRDGHQNIDGWALAGATDVSYFGGGVGGTVIGFGATMLAMTDDLYKSLADARSPIVNEAVWEWKQGTHDSRLGRRTCRIDIGTRWSKNDVLGRLESQGVYDEVIRIPALNDAGESFCEDVRTTSQYLAERTTLDPEIWAAEYMQEPIELAGTLLPMSELTMYDPVAVTTSINDYKLMVVDVADTGDNFVAIEGPIRDGLFYVENVICNNNGLAENIPESAGLAISEGVTHMRIEGNGGWIQTARDIRDIVWDRSPDTDVVIYKAKTNKEERILAQAYFIRNHCAFRRDWAEIPEYARAMKTLINYQRNVRGQSDDFIDTLAEACSHARNQGLFDTE